MRQWGNTVHVLISRKGFFMPSKPKIVIVGGGSKIWVPKLVKDMLLTPSIGNAEYVLLDIDKHAGDTNKLFLEKLADKLNVGPTLLSTDNQAEAFKGADYVVIAISTGGFDSMAYDLSIPEEYGIYHTVGDTTGPGGWARFIRNFDTFASMAENLNRHAPNAVVMNYSNPMSTLTDVLSRICRAPVVGLCHGLFESLEYIKALYDLEDENDIAVNYAGLNHFFWITKARVENVDVLADLRQRLQTKSLTELIPGFNADPLTRSTRQELATELFRLTGFLPYVGDRHTCEFIPGYTNSKDAMRKYKISRTSIEDRREYLQLQVGKIDESVGKDIDEAYFQRSRETAADIIDAHYRGKVFVDVGNLPNMGQISNLPQGVVVETAMRVDRNGFSPITFGPLPDVIQAMCQPWAKAFAMVVDACFNKDKQLAMQALHVDPLCSHLTGAQIGEMGEKLLEAHKQFITAF